MKTEKYTEEELCTMYRDAKDKSKQIHILADMAGETPQEIIEMLERNGMISGLPLKSSGKRFVFTEELTNDLVRFYDQGMKPLEISERLGIPAESVRKKIMNEKARGKIKNKKQKENSAENHPEKPDVSESNNSESENKPLNTMQIFDDLRKFVEAYEGNTITSFYFNDEDRQIVINFMRGKVRYFIHMDGEE